MSTPTHRGYMLIFRGTDWYKGLSPEEMQQVREQMMAWFKGLMASGKAHRGNPSNAKAKLFPAKMAAWFRNGRSPNPKKPSVDIFS